jgi:hypothetical protein
MQQEILDKLKRCNALTGNRTRSFPHCSIVPHPNKIHSFRIIVDYVNISEKIIFGEKEWSTHVSVDIQQEFG